MLAVQIVPPSEPNRLVARYAMANARLRGRLAVAMLEAAALRAEVAQLQAQLKTQTPGAQ